ncbi:MAG: sigma-70 family RNA polymerase sigma factor [Oscillospiraceae bacterium]
MVSMTECSREEFIEKNIGLVHACAHKFKGRGVDYEDLFQTGCIGLVKAYDGFDRTRGVMFSTYAVPVILGEIKRIFREGGSVKVSRHLKELSLKITRIRNDYAVRCAREPSIEELATELCCSCEDIVEAVCAARPSISLTTEDETEISEIDIPVACEEENIANRVSLRDEIMKLDSDERAILNYRYFCEKTQQQTASLLGTTQVQISRHERRIIKKLQQLMT